MVAIKNYILKLPKQKEMKSCLYFPKFLAVILVLVVSHTELSAKSSNDSTSNQSLVVPKEIETVISFGKNFLGKPYQFRTPEGRILDCSGFVSYIYKEIGIVLPRSAPGIAQVSKKTDLSKVAVGDLLFFKGRDINSRLVGHVAMVVSVAGNQIEMMHSCNSGIKIEKYNGNRYYTSRLLFAAKVPQLDEIDDTPVEVEKVEEKQIPSTDSNSNQLHKNEFQGFVDRSLDGPNIPFCLFHTMNGKQSKDGSFPENGTNKLILLLGIIEREILINNYLA